MRILFNNTLTNNCNDVPFWALNVSVELLSMEGQRALGFHQKYLNFCSKYKRRFYRFGRVIWGHPGHFGVNCPFKGLKSITFMDL